MNFACKCQANLQGIEKIPPLVSRCHYLTQHEWGGMIQLHNARGEMQGLVGVLLSQAGGSYKPSVLVGLNEQVT